MSSAVERLATQVRAISKDSASLRQELLALSRQAKSTLQRVVELRGQSGASLNAMVASLEQAIRRIDEAEAVLAQLSNESETYASQYLSNGGASAASCGTPPGPPPGDRGEPTGETGDKSHPNRFLDIDEIRKIVDRGREAERNARKSAINKCSEQLGEQAGLALLRSLGGGPWLATPEVLA